MKNRKFNFFTEENYRRLGYGGGCVGYVVSAEVIAPSLCPLKLPQVNISLGVLIRDFYVPWAQKGLK